jgi:N-methylhydantoinase B
MAYRVDVPGGATGSMLAMRDGIPISGMAGGDPGAPTDFRILRADGGEEILPAHADGVVLAVGDVFQMRAGTGGGWGDPLRRAPEAVARDVRHGRLSPSDARERYGVVLGGSDGGSAVMHADTEALRDDVRRDRLSRALAAPCPVEGRRSEEDRSGATPLFHGVVQCGDLAVSEASGAVLAHSPHHWTDGCPRLERAMRSATGIGWLQRTYLDPLSGDALQSEAVPADGPRSFTSLPHRWVRAAASNVAGN